MLCLTESVRYSGNNVRVRNENLDRKSQGKVRKFRKILEKSENSSKVKHPVKLSPVMNANLLTEINPQNMIRALDQS